MRFATEDLKRFQKWHDVGYVHEPNYFGEDDHRLYRKILRLQKRPNKVNRPDAKCNCKNGYPQSSGGCPVHGVKY